MRLTGFPACSTIKFISCGTGILPVDKRIIDNAAISLVEQAGKPVHQRIIDNAAISLVEQAGKPVHQRIIDN
ncbi:MULTISPECIES: hypothetical protein, partial [unclassified Microcoleus]|uniref:hypothetical protein n=1 Tax=unclassified Microcoleus TaxID=2642155 RepID=UPI002FD2564D